MVLLLLQTDQKQGRCCLYYLPIICQLDLLYLQVTGRQVSEVRRSPALPYMTSSLLTDAANQLGSSVAATMSNAQALFEGGAGGKAATALVSSSHVLRNDL